MNDEQTERFLCIEKKLSRSFQVTTILINQIVFFPGELQNISTANRFALKYKPGKYFPRADNEMTLLLCLLFCKSRTTTIPRFVLGTQHPSYHYTLFRFQRPHTSISSFRDRDVLMSAPRNLLISLHTYHVREKPGLNSSGIKY